MVEERVPEHQLQGAVARHLRGSGYIVMAELGFFSKRIDLYAVKRASLATVAVEVKVHDWKRALFQARIYQLCADRVFVAMPLSQAERIGAEAFLRDEIGLLAVDTSASEPAAWRISVVIPAPKSGRRNSHYVDCLRGETLFERFDRGMAAHAD